MSDKMNKLKEIAGENVLDKNQLDQIAGGGYGQVAVDANFFNRLGLYAHSFSYKQLRDDNDLYHVVLKDMELLYEKYDIIFSCSYGGDDNTYRIRGTNQHLTLEEAQAYVLKQIKKGGK
jgi:hypothetical protein